MKSSIFEFDKVGKHVRSTRKNYYNRLKHTWIKLRILLRNEVNFWIVDNKKTIKIASDGFLYNEGKHFF